MKWFYNFKIAVKLIASFTIMALIAAVVDFVGLYNMKRITNADTLLFEQNTLGINYTGNASTYYQRLKYNIAEAILLKDDSLRENYVSSLNGYIETIDEQLASYESGITNQEDLQIFSELKPQWEQYRSYMKNVIQYIQYGQYENAQKMLLEEADDIGDEVRDLLVSLVEYNERHALERSELNAEMARTAETLMILIIIIGIIIAVVLGLFIARIISKPITKVVEAADRLAVGECKQGQ